MERAVVSTPKERNLTDRSVLREMSFIVSLYKLLWTLFTRESLESEHFKCSHDNFLSILTLFLEEALILNVDKASNPYLGAHEDVGNNTLARYVYKSLKHYMQGR